MQRHIALSAGILQRAMIGAGPGQYLEDFNRIWTEWAATVTQLGAFPIEWLTREMMHVPTLVFMVDPAAEATTPASTMTPISFAGLPVRSTDLEQLGGAGKIAAEHVWLQIGGGGGGGDRVEVSLTDLGGTQEERERRGIRPGHYVGIVYAEETPTCRPLVIVHALIAA